MAVAFIRGPDDRIAQHRLLYKGKTPLWKDKYRQQCRDRLKEARESLLSRFRQLPESCCTAHLSAVQQVMDDEWSKMEVTDDQCLPVKETSEIISPTDCEVNYVLSVMEDIQKELLDEEQELLTIYQEQLMDTTFHSRNDTAEHVVLCPVCQRCYLKQTMNIISCTCGIVLNTEHDGFTLRHLQLQLETGVKEHRTSCSSTPRFSATVEHDIHNIIMTCVACDYMYIVM